MNGIKHATNGIDLRAQPGITVVEVGSAIRLRGIDGHRVRIDSDGGRRRECGSAGTCGREHGGGFERRVRCKVQPEIADRQHIAAAALVKAYRRLEACSTTAVAQAPEPGAVRS